MNWAGLYSRLAVKALRDPSLASALVTVGWRFRRRNWYRRFPFLPTPSREYLRWRMHTAYRDQDTVPPIDDVIRYVKWAAQDQKPKK